MNNKIKIIFSIIFLLFTVQNNFSQVKLAQSGMKFLSLDGDARSAAMGGAVASVEGNSASQYYNPSSVARQTSEFDISLTNTLWIADINYIHAALTYAPANGLYGVFGLTFENVDYGAFDHTILGPNDGLLDIGIYKPSAIAAGVSYARALSEKFSVGGDVRYVYQNFGEGFIVGGTYDDYETQKIDLGVFAFDFGVLYKTGFKSLNLGMSVRNFSQEIKYFEENFQLPLTFSLGLSMNMLDIWDVSNDKHAFILAVDVSHPRDNVELLRIGGEYTLYKTLSIRGGYITNSDIAKLSAGLGFVVEDSGTKFGFDYSYFPADYFSDVHKIAVKMSL
jgi:hypothetical protein